MLKSLLVLLAIIASSCTTIDHSYKEEGWPEMKITEHYVSHKEMRDRCSKYASWWESPEACAEWNLETKTCDIWYSSDFPPSKVIIEHEQLHCQGHLKHGYLRLF